jgi:hypothetical protein
VICLLLFTVLVTGCGQNLNETATKMTPETEITSQTETTITETETEATTEVPTTMVSDAKAED